jgi:hypothetical protein
MDVYLRGRIKMTNEEFNYLMKLEKHVHENSIVLPNDRELGETVTVLSNTTKHVFVIDSDRRSTISISKMKLQERYMNVPEKMVRLEIDCRPHTNPDGTKLSRNYIHIYTEEYGMSFAYDLDGFHKTLFKDTNNYYAYSYYNTCQK